MTEASLKVDSHRTTGFRLDINGLRAWAVVLVMLFHFEVPGFEAGFIGVDVFFVISGYLMTRIIVSELAAGTFSIAAFYFARALRILPALAVLCASLLAAGWYWLSATEYKILAEQALTSLTFVSNIQFWREAGYFDAASHDKLLLHTWSLSLEWQFYLAFPILVVMLWRWRPDPNYIRGALLITASLSLVLCLLVERADASAAFYLLPTRAWQLLVGGLIYLYSGALANRVSPRWLEVSGLLLLLFAASPLGSTWPGAGALLPVLGSALVIASSRRESRLLSSSFVQWTGTRSYSIYLFHWPIAVALHYLQMPQQPVAVLSGFALSFALGHLSYVGVERLSARLRRSLRAAKTRSLLGVAGLPACIAIMAALVMYQAGVPGRMPASVDLAAAESRARTTQPDECWSIDDNPGTACRYGGPVVRAILVGDSHALAVASALAAARPDRDSGVMAWIYPSCITIFSAKMVPGVFRSGQKCDLFNRWVIKSLAAYPRGVPIVLVSRTTAYVYGFTEGLDRSAGRPAIYFNSVHNEVTQLFEQEFKAQFVSSACRLAEKRPVFILRPIPEMGVDVPKAVSRNLAMGRTAFPSIAIDDYQRRHQLVLAAQQAAQASCNVRILDPTSILCNSGHCISELNGRPIYYDDDHLSEFGNKLLVPMFRAVFAAASEMAGTATSSGHVPN